MTELSTDDLRSMMLGARLYGAGGGGTLKEGEYYIRQIEKLGRNPVLVHLSSLPRATVVAAASRMGAVHTPASKLSANITDRLVDEREKPPSIIAFEALSATLPSKIEAMFPIELGAVNSMLAFYVAAYFNIPVVDADGAGRCVAELPQLAVEFGNLPKNAISVANYHGETAMVTGVTSPARAESLLRGLCMASGEAIAFVEHALPISTIGPNLVPGTLSKCLQSGRIIRQVGAGEDLAEKVAADADGKVIFKGKVSDYSFNNQGGITKGTVIIVGMGAFSRKEATISFSNENMSICIDGEVAATIPEIISILEDTSGKVVNHPDVAEGMAVSVVILPAPAPYLSEHGLRLFGPSYAGITGSFQSAL